MSKKHNPRCLYGQTKILMADGTQKAIYRMEVGDMLLSWNGETFEPDVVKNVYKLKHQKKCKEVGAYGLPSIIVSHDHRFAVYKEDRVAFRCATEFKNSERLLVYNYGDFTETQLASAKYARPGKWKGCYRRAVSVRDTTPRGLYEIVLEKNNCFIANGYIVHDL